MPKKRILVVDDEPKLVDMLKMRLESEGYGVVTAFDGEEGLTRVKQYAPDLIILDIVMPKMSGDTMAEILKDDDKTRDIPIIFLTCLAEGVTERQEACMSGGNCFLAKPFDDAELLLIVEKLIKKEK